MYLDTTMISPYLQMSEANTARGPPGKHHHNRAQPTFYVYTCTGKVSSDGTELHLWSVSCCSLHRHHSLLWQLGPGTLGPEYYHCIIVWKQCCVTQHVCHSQRLIGIVVQSRRRTLLGPSLGWKRLLVLSQLRILHFAQKHHNIFNCESSSRCIKQGGLFRVL